MEDFYSSEEECLERALADLELLQAAYPDEIFVSSTDASGSGSESTTAFPLRFSLHLDGCNPIAKLHLEFKSGYPLREGVTIATWVSNSQDKARMQATVMAMKKSAQESLKEGQEGGFACCSAALDTWNNYNRNKNNSQALVGHLSSAQKNLSQQQEVPQKKHSWISGTPLVDRKSTFTAHLCRVSNEIDVREALSQLIDGSSKLQRATHNMWAYRVTETLHNGVSVLKHDNDDDGENAAGSRMAHLLQIRKEDGVLLVVSRWSGGIKLGSKRFGHITNVAREMLDEHHAALEQESSRY